MDYTRLVQTAQRLIAKSGQKVVWRVAGNPVAADPAKPWLASPADPSTEFDTIAVFLPIKSVRYPGLTFAKDTDDVPFGSVTVLIAGNSNFEPAMNDLCLREDSNGNIETLRVLRCNTLRPSALSVLHTLVMAK